MKRLLPSLILLMLAVQSYSQDAHDRFIDNRGDDSKLAPRIGLGTGFFTYLGDVRDNNFSHPFTSSWGYEFRASANMTKYFDLNLDIVYGDITVNERSREPHRNRNFRSEVFVGGVGVSYNFNHLYRKRPGIVQPYIGVGVAFIHFDSKTDLHDANGNRYHYWSDGSIMDRPEDSESAWQAIELQRDYTYETDLRQMNNDGLGKYDLFTFSVPVSAGLDFKMGRRVSARLGASFHYTFTDLMDDFTHRGNGDREGNKRNDMFLFTSLSVAYAIGVGRSEKKVQKDEYFENIDFLAIDLQDTDGDGVPDFADSCAYTPEGVKVDERGCPLDTDRDLIPDYRDQEEFTGADMIANLQGIGLTDEMIWERYIDSVATDRARIAIIYPSGVMEKTPGKEAETTVFAPEPTAQQAAESTSAPAGSTAQTETATARHSSTMQPEGRSADGTSTGKTGDPGTAKTEGATVTTVAAGASGITATTGTAGTAGATSASPSTADAAVTPFTEPTPDEMQQLSELVSTIADDAGKETPSSQLMDAIAKEVFSGSPEDAASVGDVYDVAYRVYGKMVDEGRIDDRSKLDITHSAAASTAIPKEYVLADFNNDGVITSDEVLRAIEEMMDGSSPFSVGELLGLVEFYKDKMSDARVVDFGGTMAIYVDGKLNILPNYKKDGLTAQQRFLVKKYPDVDYNGDGKLTPDEVNRAIIEFKGGRSRYTADDINELIDLFFED